MVRSESPTDRVPEAPVITSLILDAGHGIWIDKMPPRPFYRALRENAAPGLDDLGHGNRSLLSHDSVTRGGSPEVSSTAFSAQPPDLPPVCLVDAGFAVHCQLAPPRRLIIRFCSSAPTHPDRAAGVSRGHSRPRKVEGQTAKER